MSDSISDIRKSESDPSCWICFEEGSDQLGKPLVRDCSCRGDAGYAHLACIKEFAQRTSIELNSDRLLTDDETNVVKRFTVAWERCSICHQRYQHELALELANTLLLFLEDDYPNKGGLLQQLRYQSNKSSVLYILRYIDALKMKLEAIRTMAERKDLDDLFAEGKQAAYKIISMAQQIESIAGPKEGQPYEAYAYEQIGHFYFRTQENYEQGINFTEKARDIYSSIGEISSAKRMDTNLAIYKSKHEGRDGGQKSSDEDKLKNARDLYEHFIQSEGQSTINTITVGLKLCACLHDASHAIECDRLTSKIAAISLRVYGPEHDISKHAVSMLEVAKRRIVLLLSKEGLGVEALRYNAGRDEYIVKKARRKRAEDEETFTVTSDDLIYPKGIPVVCHGLVNASHLNGKIGDVRTLDEITDRYGVYFEDKNLDPAAVKPENLRIVFELPAVVEEYEDVKASSNAVAAGATAETQTEEAAAAIAEADEAHIAAVLLAETRAEETAAALLAELDLEGKETSSTTNQQKGKKKKKGGRKKRNR